MPYIIELSNGSKIKLDSDELPNVIEGIQRKAVVKIRQGLFNPSFFVCVVEDKERVTELRNYNDRNKTEIAEGRMTSGKFASLKNIFQELKLLN